MNTTELKFFGQRVLLRSTNSDPVLSAEVLELVSARLDAAEKRAKGPKNQQQVLLLALLDLAEEYIHAKKRVADYQTELKNQTGEILAAFEPPSPEK